MSQQLLKFNQFIAQRKVLFSHLLALILGLLMADLAQLYFKRFIFSKTSSLQKVPKRKKTSSGETSSIRKTTKKPLKIVSRNLFDYEGLIPSPLVPESSLSALEEKAVLSTLPIRLVGTIVYTEKDLSLATVQGHNNAMEATFRTGENITPQARLLYVVRDKIFIDNLSTKKIEFIKNQGATSSLSFGPNTSSSSLRSKSNSLSSRSVSPSSSSYSNLSKQIAPNKFKINRKEILKLTKNLGQLLKLAKAVPNKDKNGKINGFKLVYIKPNSPFTVLGLRKNDVIHAVNGKEVTSPAQAMELYQKLQKSDYLELTLGRNAKKEKMSYNLE